MVVEHGDQEIKGVYPSVKKTEVLNLAVNLNPYPIDVKKYLIPLIEENIYEQYPDDEEAEEAVARFLGIGRERIILTNGASEAISLLANYLRCGNILEPEFSLYKRHLPKLGGNYGLWISNPKNPTGELAPLDLKAVVWDESFYAMSTGKASRGILENAYVIGSFTKLLAIPGLRIGYLVVKNEEEKNEIQSKKIMWSVNSIALGLIKEALKEVDLEKTARLIKEKRVAMMELFSSYGVIAYPSDAPYFIIEDSNDLYLKLRSLKILTRNCASFNLAKKLRVAVTNDEGIERLKDALAKIFS